MLAISQGPTLPQSLFRIASTGDIYNGPISADPYGRITPKYAHGTGSLERWTSSTRRISDAMMELYDRIVHPDLLVRRIYVVAVGLLREEDIPEEAPLQLDLFTDYESLSRQMEEDAAADAREKRLQEAALDIQERFGKNAMLKGINLAEGGQVGGHRA